METKHNVQPSTIHDPFIRVAIVDDHKVVAEGFEHLISESGVARVTGKAYSAVGCLQLLEKAEVDVLLLDISLPDGNGIELCPQIKAKYPNLKILMLTSYSELTIITRALQKGASGYALKNSMTEEIIEGIRTVMSGKRFLCEEVDLLMKKPENPIIRLSRREQELLRLIVDGKSNSEIAGAMFLGYETIKTYRKNLILKLNVHNTATLVKTAIEQKLV
ncbi:MAG: response regulator transcription factor [Tannerella sp.]|jgi:DNA-binding NarL/FixJ family response regulator|nr:response regulator transcription factor [Tannerella sp.]